MSSKKSKRRAIVRYLTHPQVRVDPAVAVPRWPLSQVGLHRTRSLAAAGCVGQTQRIVSSAEVKAVETARILGAAWGIPVEIRKAMHENDRSATGFLPAQEFEAAAERFFAEPSVSFRGWETAQAAQDRILREVTVCLAAGGDGDILLVGHGAVGTLLYCALAGLDIDRRHDQVPTGGGNWFAFAADTRRPLHGWRPMEEMA